MINVQPNTPWGDRCRVLGKPIGKCRKQPTFSIFGDDGVPKLSRLEGVVCADHLALAVRRVNKVQKAKKE